jgi:hypothetical protein
MATDRLNRVSVKAGQQLSLTDLQSLANERTQKERKKNTNRVRANPSVHSLMKVLSEEQRKRSPTANPTGKDAGLMKSFIAKVHPVANAYDVMYKVCTEWKDFLAFMKNRDGWEPNAPYPTMGIIHTKMDTCIAYFEKGNVEFAKEKKAELAKANEEAIKSIWG